MKRKLALIALLLVVLPAPDACALPEYVLVDLFRAKPPTDHVVIEGPVLVQEPARGVSLNGSHYEIRAVGRQLQVRSTDVSVVRNLNKAQGTSLLTTRTLTLAPAFRPVTVVYGIERRTYAGTVTIQADGSGHLIMRNKVPVRDYVKSVVGSETNPDFKEEALKAQAVLTQTLVARYKPGDLLSDTTEKQAYMGTHFARPPVVQAVDAVWGNILTYKNLPATVYYHSTCAGGTSNGERYFQLKKGGFPYLASVNCDHCLSSPFFTKKDSVIPQAQFQKAFGRTLPRVLECDERKRPLKVSVNGRTVHGFQFWTDIGKKLGWDKVPGTMYAISSGPDNKVHLTSSGAGHGVGLCQWGANGLAKLGKNYAEILEYYFPGASVQQSK